MSEEQCLKKARDLFGPRATFRGAQWRELVIRGDQTEPEDILGCGSTHEDALMDAVEASRKESA